MKKNSEIIFETIQELENQNLQGNFHTDDVRNYFYGIILTNLVNYLKGYFFLELSTNLVSKQSQFSNAFTNYEQHVILDTVKSKKSVIHYLSPHHRNLIIGSWNIFELLITCMCDKLISVEAREELLSFQVKEILDKKNTLNEAGKKYLLKKHLADVPITRKYNVLIKFADKYSRNWNDDKKFLEFLRDFRNAGMHSNFIHFGSEKPDYIFRKVKFRFQYGKIVDYDDPNPLSPTLYLSLSIELVKIVNEIIRAIQFNDLIPYPDLKAQIVPSK